MNGEERETLVRAMADLAETERRMTPPAELESILLREFDAAKRVRHFRRFAAGVGAMAAAAALFAVLHLKTPGPVVENKPAATAVRVLPAIEKTETKPVRKPAPRQVRTRQPAKPAEDRGAFVAIPYTLPLDPHEPVAVIRVSMPVTALVAVGLANAAPDPSAVAQADALVSEDGRIRALRLVSYQSSDFSSDRRTNP